MENPKTGPITVGPINGGPGLHSHANLQESFYVIDGEIEVKSEGATYTAKKGSFVNIPKGRVVPSGLEEFFMEIGTRLPLDLSFLLRQWMRKP